MTYRVTFAAGAAAQYHDLPVEAQDALVARAVELADEPWDASVLLPGDDQRFREATFDDGLGLIGFHVDDDSETLRIFNLVWVG
ncbi:MAG TPA: hypothetical protein VFJ19_16385 [Nocardioidaceae bacterium]|nr:hypothetical protein [Nocardioidaceae bacterium]